jgi:predicted solute-binding protein
VALFLEHERQGIEKIDLGEVWTRHTGLPFVWAFWAGRPGAVPLDRMEALRDARDRGVAASDEVARVYCGGDASRVPVAQRYLREHVRFHLGEREREGLARYYAAAGRLGIIREARPLRFY